MGAWKEELGEIELPCQGWTQRKGQVCVSDGGSQQDPLLGVPLHRGSGFEALVPPVLPPSAQPGMFSPSHWAGLETLWVVVELFFFLFNA